MSSFSTGKWALRALSQSLAKEFGPKGVHVGHAIIDGIIDIPRTREWAKELGPEGKLSPDGVSFLLILLEVEDVADMCVDCERLLVPTHPAHYQPDMGTRSQAWS